MTSDFVGRRYLRRWSGVEGWRCSACAKHLGEIIGCIWLSEKPLLMEEWLKGEVPSVRFDERNVGI